MHRFFLFLTALLICLVASTTVLAHGMSAEDQARIVNAGLFEYMRLGATHMLSGYDHLLFLFGVMFFLTRFGDIVKLITAFTLGHSLTLVLATLFAVRADYYLIDAVIALTVCYKAFDNLDGFRKYFDMASPNIFWAVFIFGLIHGFGLSTRLQLLPLGEEGLVLKILAFNAGVEIGQIIALSVMFVVLLGWRRSASFRRLSNAVNLLLMLLGGLLLLMQLHGYQHAHYADEFPLNTDDHYHIHEDMEQQASPLLNYKKKMNLNSQPLGAELPVKND
jgi:hypothetical protein